jgi:hypothetical protein
LRCPPPSCPLFNQPGQGNLKHRRWTGKNKDIERLRCAVCRQEVSERQRTLMEKTKLPEETVTRLLKCQRWGVCDDGTADICDVDLKTVRRFQTVACRRAEAHHQQVVRDLDVAGVQLDEMHSKLRRRRVAWVLSALARGSQFILWVVVGARRPDTGARWIAQVVGRVRSLPVFLTDGWKVYQPALLRVLGRVVRPRRRSSRGRHPLPRLVAPPKLFYGQVVKVRNQAGRLIRVTTRVSFGGPRRASPRIGSARLGPEDSDGVSRTLGCHGAPLVGPVASPQPVSVVESVAASGSVVAVGRPLQLPDASPSAPSVGAGSHSGDGHRRGRSGLVLL